MIIAKELASHSCDKSSLAVPTDLRNAIEAGVQAAGINGTPQLVSHVRQIEGIEPLALFSWGKAVYPNRWYWASPGDRYEFAGIGAAWTVSAEPPGRLECVREAWTRLSSGAIVVGESAEQESEHKPSGPRLFGGCAFLPGAAAGDWKAFGDTAFNLPEIMLGRARNKRWLTINAVVESDTDANALTARLENALSRVVGAASERAVPAAAREHALTLGDEAAEKWRERVRGAVNEIRSGRLEKVVLVRSQQAHAPQSIDSARALAYLNSAYAMCYRFAFDVGPSCFLGATPELLAAVQGRAIHSMALAGSAARGASPTVDDHLGEALLADPKNRDEHAIVARMVHEALTPICESLTIGGRPQLLKLPNVQHLWTPVNGRLKDGLDLFDVVRILHPTPAVGGSPLGEALDYIAADEGGERGWYAGPIGSVDAAGDGEFAVAIRSALLSGAKAVLYAGCGIVSGSDPEIELRESRLKLRTILSSLGESPS